MVTSCLIGSTHLPERSRQGFLTRMAPVSLHDLDRDADAQALLDRFHVTADDVPV